MVLRDAHVEIGTHEVRVRVPSVRQDNGVPAIRGGQGQVGSCLLRPENEAEATAGAVHNEVKI